jgi:DNA-binding CsgD family transcriptional regulator
VGLGLGSAEVWAVLRQLADASLLTTADGPSERFGMLAPLRTFARDELDAAGETGPVHELLVEWLAGQAERMLASRARVQDPESWAWDVAAVESYRYAAAVARDAGDPRFGMLATATVCLLNDTGHRRQARDLAEDALTAPELSDHDQVRLLMALASALVLGGAHEDALAQADTAHRIASGLGDEDLLYQARSSLLYALGDADPARSSGLAREQVRAVERAGDPSHLADPLNDLAWLAVIGGDLATARAAAAQLLALRADAAGAEELHTCGTIELAAGDPDLANTHFAQGLARAAGTRSKINTIEGLGLVAAATGEAARALRLLSAAAALREQHELCGDSWWVAQIAAARASATALLPPPAAKTAAAEGRALTIGQLVRYAAEGELAGPVPLDAPLTAREAAIARLVAGGHTTRQIAARLGIGGRTVDGTVGRIRGKLGLASRPQLAAWAAEHLS